MAIIETYYKSNSGEVEKVVETHLGCVVQVRQFQATRNHSDTLDYTDFRTCLVTEALVYVGRLALKSRYLSEGETNPLVALEPKDRFRWVDCTGLFVDRGEPKREPKVDPLALAVPELFDDLQEYLAIVEKERAEADAKQAAYEAAQAKAREEQKRKDAKAYEDRPIVGRKMVVVRGKKVKVGTVGTVAYIHSNGGVLLKDDDRWKDRSAPGVWVTASNLAPR